MVNSKFSEQIEALPEGARFHLSDESQWWIRTKTGYRIDIDTLPEEVVADVKALAALTGNPDMEFGLDYAYIFDGVQRDDERGATLETEHPGFLG